MINNLYPENPQGVPAGYTSPTAAYKRQVVYVLLAMLVFLLLYFSMIAAAGYLVYLAVIYPMLAINKITILLKLGAIGMAGMLLGFLVKFLFKKTRRQQPIKCRDNRG